MRVAVYGTPRFQILPAHVAGGHREHLTGEDRARVPDLLLVGRVDRRPALAVAIHPARYLPEILGPLDCHRLRVRHRASRRCATGPAGFTDWRQSGDRDLALERHLSADYRLAACRIDLIGSDLVG